MERNAYSKTGKQSEERYNTVFQLLLYVYERRISLSAHECLAIILINDNTLILT